MKVLAAIDGSTFSDYVIETLALRKWLQGSVIKLATVLSPSEYADQSFLQTVHQNLTRVTRFLSAAQKYVRFEPEIRQGDAGETILQWAFDMHADLIIVAAHGKDGLERLLQGSVSETLLERTICPVLIAKQGTMNIEQNAINILVPVDHSIYSTQAIEWLLRQRWFKSVHIKLVTVLANIQEETSQESSKNPTSPELPQTEDENLALLKQWGDIICQKIAPATIEFAILKGDPTEEILSAADQWSANLIVMGSHGRSGLKRYFLGSVSRAVARSAQCSVEIIRMPDLAEYVRHWETYDKERDKDKEESQGGYCPQSIH